jgi:SHS2 domain-containing protein
MVHAASWEHFEHEADVGVRGRGATLEEAFACGGLALTGIVTDPATVAPATPVDIACESEDRETLFAEFLNAVIFEMATRDMLFGRYDVTIEGGRLRATAWGEPVDGARHQPAVEPKGATYTALRVAEVGSEFVVECVIDV